MDTKTKTMIDDRMFDFPDFYKSIATKLPSGAKIAEVGVANGASALFLAEEMIMQGKDFKLYMIDSLQYGGSEQLNEIIKNVVASGFAEFIEIVPVDSLNASCKYPDGFFDFVFIDASHEYELTKADIRLWVRKVKDEAIISGHDANAPEVKKAIEEVIPKDIIYDNTDNPVAVLRIEKTEKDYGVWWFKRDWQIMRNYFK